MCGRAYDPRFLFSWPSAKSAVMGPAQLAGVLSIVGRQAAAARGEAYDEVADAGMRAAVEEQIEAESQPFFLSGRIYDDGVIDPRDTRTVLGMCLSVIDSAPSGQPGWRDQAGPAAVAAPGPPRYGVCPARPGPRVAPHCRPPNPARPPPRSSPPAPPPG